MSNSIGTAYLTLVPKCDTSSLNNEGAKAGETFGSSFSSKLSTAAKAGAAAMAASVAAIGLTANAFKDAINATADYGDNVDKMSQKIGISASSYQEWSYVMERAGTSVDILQSGMKTLSTQAQSNAEEFQKLGISEQEVATLSKEDLFGRVIDGLSNMEDGTERTALSTKLLGKSATELAPLLNQGTDAINEQREMAEKYGMVMSDAAVKASADFKDSMTTLNGAVKGAKNALMGEFLPSATKVSDGLSKIITGSVDDGIKDISDGVRQMLDKLKKSFPQFLSNGSKIVLEMLNGLNNKIPDIVNGLVNLLNMLISKIPTYLPILFSAAVKLFMGIVQAIPSILSSLLAALGSLIGSGISKVAGSTGQMLAAAAQWIGSVLTAIGQKAGSIVSSIADFVSRGVQAVRDKISNMASAASDFIWGAINSIANAGGNIASTLSNLFWDAVDTVSSFAGNMWDAGANVVQGIIDGIGNGYWAVVDKIKEICSGALDAVRDFFGIHSPSRVMRNMFGYVGEGMVLGLEDSERGVSRAMDDLMDATYRSAADYGIGVNASLSTGRKTINADVVGAIDTLHNDLYAIIKDATPDGITGRQFGRLVHKYA